MPESAKDLKYEYFSSQPQYVSVNEEGIVEALAYDVDAKITCVATNGVSDYLYVHTYSEPSFIGEKKVSFYPLETYEYVINLNSGYVSSKNYKNLLLSPDDNNLEIFYDEHASKLANFKKFFFKLRYKNKIKEGKVINVNATYNAGGSNVYNYDFKVYINPLKEISIDDINLSNLNYTYDFKVYKNKGFYIDKIYEIPLSYNFDKEELFKYDDYNFKIVSNKNSSISFIDSTLDVIKIKIEDYRSLLDTYNIKYFPNKNEQNYIEFNINFLVEEVNTSLNKINFKNLYTSREKEINNIWYTNFDEHLFDLSSYDNEVYENSPLKIIICEEYKNLVNLEFDRSGFLKKINFKEYLKDDIPKEIYFKLKIYNEFEYEYFLNPHYETIEINLKNSVSGFNVYLDDIHLNANERVNVPYKNTSYRIQYDFLYDLNAKNSSYEIGDYKFLPTINVSDYGILSYSTNDTLGIKSNGDAHLIFKTTSSDTSSPLTVNFKIKTEKHPHFNYDDFTCAYEIIENNSPSKENISYHQFPVGTKFKFAITSTNPNIKKYEFYSLNESILKVDKQSGVVTCLKQGNADLSFKAYDLNNNVISIYKTVYVHESVSDFSILQSDFLSYKEKNGIIYLDANVNKSYQILVKPKIEVGDTTIRIGIKKANDAIDDFKIDNNIIKINGTEGKIYLNIHLGSDKNPFSKYKTVVITTHVLFLQNYKDVLYFIRKSIGHLGLFLITACFGTAFITMLKKPKKVKIILHIVNIVFGFSLAYFSELIQRYTPNRYFTWSDIAIDFSGYILGILFVFLILLFIFLFKKVNKKIKKTMSIFVLKLFHGKN